MAPIHPRSELVVDVILFWCLDGTACVGTFGVGRWLVLQVGVEDVLYHG